MTRGCIVYLPRLVLGRTPTPVIAEGHRAERCLGNSKSTVAQKSVFHMNLLSSYVRTNHRGAFARHRPGIERLGRDAVPTFRLATVTYIYQRAACVMNTNRTGLGCPTQYDLALGSHSMHTSADALREAEPRISEIHRWEPTRRPSPNHTRGLCSDIPPGTSMCCPFLPLSMISGRSFCVRIIFQRLD
jgi:hypothetical protein